MMSKLSLNLIDDIIFLLFACWLLVDSINGFLLRSGYSISVSQIYKLFVAIFVLIRCKDCIPAIHFVLIIIVYLSVYCVNLLFLNEDIGSSITLLSKLLTTILFYVYFMEVKASDLKYFKRNAFRVIFVSFTIFTINLILGNLGYGFSSYSGGGGFGSRGFFYAINELTAVLIVLFPWALYYVKTNFPFKYYTLFSALLLFLSYTLSTKSGIAATLLSCLLIAYLYGNSKEKIFVLITSLIFLLASFFLIQIFLNSELPLIQRISFFIEQNGVVDAITSNRLNYWTEEKAEFYNANLFSQLLGLGGNRTVEMDPFDALLNCGFVGLLFLLSFYCFLMSRPNLGKYRYCKYSKVILISNIFLIVMSIAGGHVMFSSMAGMLIAISNALLIDHRKNEYIRMLFKITIAKRLLSQRN